MNKVDNLYHTLHTCLIWISHQSDIWMFLFESLISSIVLINPRFLILYNIPFNKDLEQDLNLKVDHNDLFMWNYWNLKYYLFGLLQLFLQLYIYKL